MNVTVLGVIAEVFFYEHYLKKIVFTDAPQRGR